jgi:flagellar protein FliO/FliZ
MKRGPRLRWLLGVLAAFTVAVAAAAEPVPENQVIVPARAAHAAAPAGGATGSGLFTAVAVLALAGGGGWLLWRGRSGAIVSRTARQLVIDETRPLGNRQYLVVASYQDKKFLLGVCPGRIELLAPLHDAGPVEQPRA